jgi:hypothetical protein
MILSDPLQDQHPHNSIYKSLKRYNTITNVRTPYSLGIHRKSCNILPGIKELSQTLESNLFISRA